MHSCRAPLRSSAHWTFWQRPALLAIPRLFQMWRRRLSPSIPRVGRISRTSLAGRVRRTSVYQSVNVPITSVSLDSRDKAVVENAVHVGQRRIVAALRHRKFFSLADANQSIRRTPTPAQPPTLPETGWQPCECLRSPRQTGAIPLPNERSVEINTHGDREAIASFQEARPTWRAWIWCVQLQRQGAS